VLKKLKIKVLPTFVWGIPGWRYKAMRIRASSKSFRLMPTSLNIIKLQFISTNSCASDSKKPGDLLALIENLCLPLAHRNPGRTKMN